MNTDVMKVLWITHDAMTIHFPAIITGKPSRGGSWIDPLFSELLKIKNLKLGIIVPVLNGDYEFVSINNSDLFTIPIRRKENGSLMTLDLAERYLEVIRKFKPDLIHVHGTENNFGQIAKYLPNTPVVCSIQGIISSYLPYLEMSGTSFRYKEYRSWKNIFGRGGISNRIISYTKYLKVEKEIFNSARFFIGRTDWDYSQLRQIAPKAYYFHGEELLRPEFYDPTTGVWSDTTMEPRRIFISSGAYSIKGLHILLDAASILINEYPDLKIVSPLASGWKKSSLARMLIGEDYANCIAAKVKKYKLENSFEFLGRLSAQEMREQYLKCNAFVLPSFVENSPNSLGEAMILGVPCVSAACGGVLSILEHEKSGLLFPIGDSALLAQRIRTIFDDNSLATNLGKHAREIGLRRHDLIATADQYVNIYKKILLELNNGEVV